MVAYLESIAGNEEHIDGILAGALLFCLMGRARVGDLRRGVVEPFRDVSAGSPIGFLQTELTAYKTARPGTKKGMPVVAPTPGVTGTDWGQTWLARRESNGLDAGVGFGIFAAPVATGGFSTLALKTSEVGKELRRILAAGGFAEEALTNIGAHSLKATCLTWAAKRGLSQETRRLLGYHRLPGERSTASYSRDELAGPLRELATLLGEIRSGTFLPDATRSGYLRGSAPSSSTSSSSDPSPSSAASDDPDLPESAGDAVLNEESGILHRLAEGGRLECGRARPLKAVTVSSWAFDQRLCRICF